MDAVRMLVHDHEVLTSQVEHVSALVRGLADNDFKPAAMRDELVQQVDALRDQLLEHFAFEEEAAFPFLMTTNAGDAERLRALALSHDKIARCLVEVADLARITTKDTLRLQTGPIAAAFERFMNQYRTHVQEESEVLDAMESLLTGEQRQELSEIAKKLV